jgi:DNA-binding transcriptional ArsR family regulator
MADVFDVVADPTRRDILRLLHHAPTPGEMSVGELVEALGVTQPTVSKHLKILRDAGVVGVREVGQHRYYRGELGALADVGAWMVEVGQGAEETPAPPYVDLTFAGRALGSVVRDVEKWATSLWGRLPR